jgi:hypothetical protein
MRSCVRKTLFLARSGSPAAVAQAFRICRFAAALAISFLSFAGGAQAQNPSQPSPQASIPAVSLHNPVGGVTAPEVTPAPRTGAGGTYYPGLGMAPSEPRCEMSFCETITESLFGDASAEGRWRPLTLGNFFSEGWREPWVGGPAGQSGLTPRHGWLGAFEGVFYRLGLVNGTYQHNLNKPYGGDAYGSNFAAFLPFSRRFEIKLDVPFVVANGTEDPTRGYRSDFGDVSVAAGFLLSETEACTQLFNIGVILPTGQTETGGHQTALFPRYSFWSNPCDAWVVRGGTGVNIPLNDSTAQTTFNADLAIGRYFRPHDVAFGDLVFYVNCNVIAPLEGGGQPIVGVGPGTRFQITGNWYFLNYLEFQVGANKPYDYQVQAAIVRAW